YALNRETGEPIWPIEERPVPQSTVPGEKLSPTQPFPTRPAPFELQGRAPEHLIDYTPEIYEQALRIAEENNLFNPLFNPPTTINEEPAWNCPGGAGGANITGPAVGDPVNGIVFVTSQSQCFRLQVMPGIDSDREGPEQAGSTVADWVAVLSSVGCGAGGATVSEPAVGEPLNATVLALSECQGARLQAMPGIDTEREGPEQAGSTLADWVALSASVGFGAGPPLDGLPIWRGPDGRIV